MHGHREGIKKGKATETNKKRMEGNKILFESKPATESIYLPSPVADYGALKGVSRILLL